MPRVQDGQADFTGGMNDRVAPERLGPTQFASAKNMETRYGGIRSRRGSWRTSDPKKTIDTGEDCTVTGLAVFSSKRPGDGDRIISSLYDPSADETNIYSCNFPETTQNLPMKVFEEELGDERFVDTVLARDNYLVSFDGKVEFNFVQAYNVMYALRDGLAPFKWDGIDDDTWGLVPSGTSGPMPNARDGLYAYNRVWLMVGDDTIVASDLLDPNWDAIDNEFRVEQGDGTRLTAIREFSDGNLIAFKERGIALISGASNFVTTSDLSMKFIDDKVGCIAPNTAVNIGKDIFFMGREGVWTIFQTSEQNAQLIELPLSEPIHGLMKQVSWQYAENFTAEAYDNYYILGVSVNGSEYPNRMLVFDIASKVWVGYWEVGATPLQFSFLKRLDLLGTDYLALIGSAFSFDIMLRGDVVDSACESTYAFFDDGSMDISAIDYTSHTDGVISIEFDPRTMVVGGSLNMISGDLQIGASFSSVAFAGGTAVLVTVLHSGSSVINTFYFRRDLLATNTWTLDIACTPEGMSAYINGRVHDISRTAFGTADFPDIGENIGWLDTVTTLSVNATNYPIRSVRISSDSATGASPQTVWFPFRDLSASTTTYYTTSPAGVVATASATVTGYTGTWYTEVTAECPSQIESILKTRGMLFGSIMTAKSGLRGELRFAHGQPSVTCEMLNDMPFDTETLTSLNAKTYSLSAYEVASKAAWSVDNANDDFATPFREDYAPVALPVDIGNNGFYVDIYREHTEFFTSMAVPDWIQFLLTNTTGFVRYNALNLETESRDFQQDKGN